MAQTLPPCCEQSLKRWIDLGLKAITYTNTKGLRLGFRFGGLRGFLVSTCHEIQEAFSEEEWRKVVYLLDHDGVPWNNTNAEHAIKRFAKYAGRPMGALRSGAAGVLVLASVFENLRVQQRQHSQILAFERDDVGRATRLAGAPGEDVERSAFGEQ